jgi:hypothetical protein
LIWATVAALPPLADGADVTGAAGETGVEVVTGPLALPLALALAAGSDDELPLHAATSRANAVMEISGTGWSRI